MNCVGGQQGQFLCINRQCQCRNSYICSDPTDSCKKKHETCALINLPYLLKKCDSPCPSTSTSTSTRKLSLLLDKAKSLVQILTSALASHSAVQEIRQLLDSNLPLKPEHKDMIAKFVGERSDQGFSTGRDSGVEGGFLRVEKEVEEFQGRVVEFQAWMKEIRDRQIMELRKRVGRDDDRDRERYRDRDAQHIFKTKNDESLVKQAKKQGKTNNSEDKMVSNPRKQLKTSIPQSPSNPISSNSRKPLKTSVEQKSSNTDSPIKNIKETKQKYKKKEKARTKDFQQLSPIRSKHSQKLPDKFTDRLSYQMQGKSAENFNIKMESDKFGNTSESFNIKFPSKFMEKQVATQNLLPIISEKSIKQKRQLRSSSLRQHQFDQKLTSTIKNHIPKPPLFSKITNDIHTINQLFDQHFRDAKLLYRASQNDYSVGKFHDKCDGRAHTLTLILTEYNKVIGGYTPLPWRSGGGEWYEDLTKKSFIFSVTTGEKYPIREQDKAIWCSRTYGPSFGHPDLQISDKAFHNSNSCANLPNCYGQVGKKLSVLDTQNFCGTRNGHFRVREWEVYQVSFTDGKF